MKAKALEPIRCFCYNCKNMAKLKLNDLNPLREALLVLHLELLELEKQKYEARYGKIESPKQYFLLTMQDPNFQWLRSLSMLIVSMDEFIESDDENPEQIDSLLRYLKKILDPSNEADEFAKKYYTALQDHPQVTVAHGKVMKELANLQPLK